MALTDFIPISPELALLVGVLVLLVGIPARYVTAAGALVVLLVAGLDAVTINFITPTIFQLQQTGVTTFLVTLATVTTFFLLWLGEGYNLRKNLPRIEFVVLLLLALLGIRIMLQATHMVPLYVGLEMMSLAFYVLTAFNPSSRLGAEAGVKYFTLGALASSFILFGVSLLYGLTGSLALLDIATVLAALDHNMAALVAITLIAVGILFKLSIVPFHMWTPDVYSGAPLPVMITLATLGKIAAVGLFIVLLYGPLFALSAVLKEPLAIMAGLSMLLGALLAIRQTNLQRLLAYSSITHMGFALMALLVFTTQSLAMALVFTIIYTLTTLTIGGVLLSLRHQQIYPETVGDLAALAKTRPWLAMSLLITLLSLAGLPPFMGFFAKVYVFQSAFTGGFITLVIVGALASAIAVYYALLILKGVYFAEASPQAYEKNAPILPHALAISGAILLVALFLWHQPLLDVALESAMWQTYITHHVEPRSN